MSTRNWIGYGLIVGSIFVDAKYTWVWAPMLIVGAVLLIWPNKN